MTASTDLAFTPAAEHALRSRWGIAPVSAPRRLYGGEESTAFAVGAHAVRLGPRWRSTAAAEWCHAIAARAAPHLPEALAPLPTADGATVVRVADRPMSVWPLVEGAWPEPTAAGVPEQAAALLARLHGALAPLRPPPRPVPSFFGAGLDGAAPPADPRLQDPGLDRRLAELHNAPTRRQPVHGDFHPGNTLAADGAFVAVLRP
ncbi:phosphotransferase family enzyme [Murinocardiopsis flavida]|uniref:Phosphotransferase family enzyme n=1 Tax=Murinocardiopsis flavida TaxID=645275 RepID=A0A2P8DMM6_9ACTN|nr:phosphotransferase [Murinocardiopsis flavida]PSK98461.1 phosphotransferase family enzyme [Murinocardiopsis flavida]